MDKSAKAINMFVKSIIDENYADAESHLRDAVVEKIKNRIRECERKQSQKK